VYKEYDQESLKKVHEKEVIILKKFEEICRKYDLKYFAVYGTLLGTIRHEGFIPWDDDLDVGMLREDYDKFLEIAQDELGEEFFLQTPMTEKEFHLPFAKIRMNGTRFVEPAVEGTKMNHGIYIDIFPFDNLSDCEKQAKRQFLSTGIWTRLYSIRFVKTPQIGNRGGLMNGIAKFVWYFLHYGMKLLHLSSGYLWAQCEKSKTTYRREKTKRVALLMSEGASSIIHMEDLETLLDRRFEDIMIKVPCGYDKILTLNYGEYMKLPSEDQRVNHCPVELDFGEE
jgi:lipopolysaccharide cholinephosphotransferase